MHERVRDAERKREESVLREKLTGQAQSFQMSYDDEATAAAIQFEADALNSLLVECDRTALEILPLPRHLP